LNQINWVSEERNMSDQDKKDLYDSQKNYNVIMKTPQMKNI